MKTPLLISAAAVVALAAGAAWLWLTPSEAEEALPEPGAPLVAITLPESLPPEARTGSMIFAQACAQCHGDNATGRMGMGPPLVHRIYEPNHHGDEAFQLAVVRGVSAHHWRFGDMPPQEGLTRGDVTMVVAYIRALQRANGIR